MVSSQSNHHDHGDIIRDFKANITKNVAPGKTLNDDPPSIAKRLTSKFKKLLSKIRNARQRSVDWQFKVDDARLKLKSVYPKLEV
jgi:hypothetical protein